MEQASGRYSRGERSAEDQDDYEQHTGQIATGSLKVQIGRVFHLDEIVEAHRAMDANTAGGKIVVLT